MKLEKDLFKIYKLFGTEKEDDFYALRTLSRIYSSNILADKINPLKPFLSEYCVHPYLVLENLADDKENEITEILFNDITKNLFPQFKNSSEIIKKIENPSKDNEFIENLIKIIAGKKRNEKFNDSSKAKDLLELYGEKEHIRMIIDYLEPYVSAYNKLQDKNLERR